MLTAEQINSIHHLHWSEHWSVRKIARHLHLGRGTISHYLVTPARMAGTVKQWKAVVSSANGSQTDHSLSVADHPLRERYWSSPAKI